MAAVVKVVTTVVKAVAKTVERVVETVVDTAKAIIKDPLPTIAALAGQAIGIPAPVTMAAITGARGGDLGDMAKAAAIAYVAPKAASQVASTIAPTVSSAITNEAAAKAVTAATSKALVNGSIAAATGGDFGEAAAGTMAGSLAASGYQNYVAPSVMAKAQDMGLSVADAKNISAGLRTGVAAGTATAVSGGDFVAGFATAVADYGIEEGFEKAGESFKTSSVGTALRESPIGDAARKISETMDNVTDAIDNAFKKKDVTNTASLGNGVPNDVVNQVPVSPNAQPGVVASTDGKTIGTINPASNDEAFNQIVAAFEEPRTPSKQLGVPTASLTPIYAEDIEGQPVSSTQVVVTPDASKYGTASSFAEATNQDILEALSKKSPTTEVPEPKFGAATKTPDINIPIKVDQDFDDLRSLQKAASGASTAPVKAPAPIPAPAPSLPELEAAAQEAKAAAVDANVVAQAMPTPDNMQAARDAQLGAELAQAALNDAAQKTDLVPGAPTDLTPPETVSTTFPGEAPAEVTGQPTTFTPPTELPSTGVPDGGLQPSTIGGMIRGDGEGVTGGLGTLSPEAGEAGSIPGGVPGGMPGGEIGGVDTGLPGGAEEGIPQLPPIEVIGEEDERYMRPPVSGTGQPAGAAKPSTGGGLGGGNLDSGQFIRRRRVSPLRGLLSPTDQGLLGDLGSGVVFIEDLPYELLQPSMLARGGLIRLKKV
jgi:hypothetical protein